MYLFFKKSVKKKKSISILIKILKKKLRRHNDLKRSSLYEQIDIHYLMKKRLHEKADDMLYYQKV